MNLTHLDKLIAYRQLNLKNSNSCLSFFTTLLKGHVIMFTFDNVNNAVTNVFNIDLENENLIFLSEIAEKYLTNSREWLYYYLQLITCRDFKIIERSIYERNTVCYWKRW